MTNLENVCAEVLEKWKEAAITPWRLKEKKMIYSGEEEVEIWGVLSNDDETIIETDCGLYPPKRPEAEYIITACNNADKLALACIEMKHNILRVGGYCAGRGGDLKDVADELLSTLASVEEILK